MLQNESESFIPIYKLLITIFIDQNEVCLRDLGSESVLLAMIQPISFEIKSFYV